MARTTKRAKKKSSKQAARGPKLPAVDPEVVRRVAPPLGVGLAVLLACGSAVLAVGALESRLAERRSTEPAITIAWPALDSDDPDAPETWLPVEFQDDLVERARIALGDAPDPFSVEPLERVAVALRGTGWFVSPPTVTRRSGDEIHVEGEWRQWSAVVRVRGRDYLLSRDGHPMPPAVGYAIGQIEGAIAITNPSLEPPGFATGTPDYSRPWPGDDLPAALRLVQLLADKPFASQIVSVDLERYYRSDSLTIVTTPDPDTGVPCSIDWGAPPGGYTPGESSVEEKLEQLRYFYDTTGHIAAGTTRYDLRPDTVVIDRSGQAGGSIRGRPDR